MLLKQSNKPLYFLGHLFFDAYSYSTTMKKTTKKNNPWKNPIAHYELGKGNQAIWNVHTRIGELIIGGRVYKDIAIRMYDVGDSIFISIRRKRK